MWAKQRGFTIVELLVVIVVIAILSAVSILAFNGIQHRARDSQRASDISSIDKAIKLYITDKGHAPDFSGDCTAPGQGDGGCFSNDRDSAYPWSSLAAELQPYIKTLPKDPCGEACDRPGYLDDNLKYLNGFFSYRYDAPANFPSTYQGKIPTKTDYTIYAQNQESKPNGQGIGFGFGSF